MKKLLLIALLIVGCNSEPDIPELLIITSNGMNKRLPMEINQWTTMQSSSAYKKNTNLCL